ARGITPATLSDRRITSVVPLALFYLDDTAVGDAKPIDAILDRRRAAADEWEQNHSGPRAVEPQPACSRRRGDPPKPPDPQVSLRTHRRPTSRGSGAATVPPARGLGREEAVEGDCERRGCR